MALQFRKASYEPGVAGFGNGCFAYLQPDGGWGFSNAGLVTDGGAALLVDTMFDTAHTRAMLDGFARVSRAPIGTLVNTHHNGDHCYGNGCVEGCEIVATAGAAEAMRHETPQGLAQLMKAAPGLGLMGEYLVHCFGDFDFENCSVRAPDTTFTGTASRMVGSKRVDLIEVGAGAHRRRRPRPCPGGPDAVQRRHPVHRRTSDRVGGAGEQLDRGLRDHRGDGRRDHRAGAWPGDRQDRRGAGAGLPRLCPRRGAPAL
ncbi:MAG: MBL fold metallo-hydrolase [Rhizomicrobium sp.]